MRKKSKGNIFIVSAPSGAGKTTLCRKIVESVDNLKQLVSFATRKPRKGEVNDVDYTFVSEDAFRKMIASGDFIEWAEVHGNLYGTSRKRLSGLVRQGYDVILDIDTQGAQQIRESYEGGVFIFILPPSMKVLEERLEKRKSNTPQDMRRRLKRAVHEIRDYYKYDYVIVNDHIKDSLRKLESIITAERLSSGKIDKTEIKRILNT